MPFGQRLREVVKYYRYTQDDFAKIIGTSKANLFNYFADKTKPNIEIIARLKKEHPDLNIDWLITGEGNLLVNKNADHEKIDIVKESLPSYGYKELLKEKDKRIKTLEDLVDSLRDTINRLENSK